MSQEQIRSPTATTSSKLSESRWVKRSGSKASKGPTPARRYRGPETKVFDISQGEESELTKQIAELKHASQLKRQTRNLVI
jgi:hypothetical protein